MSPAQRPSMSLVIAAFAAVYLIWGSTYLAIRYAVETLPPFLMAGCRYIVAGGILLAWARWKGMPWPRWIEWKGAALVGTLMVGFTAFAWLLQVVAPSKVATNSFVNPLIAVVLGCALGKEPFSFRLILCAALIATGVILILRGGASRPTAVARRERSHENADLVRFNSQPEVQPTTPHNLRVLR